MLVGHTGIVSLVVWSERRQIGPSQSPEPLILLQLPAGTRAGAELKALSAALSGPKLLAPKARSQRIESNNENAVLVPPEKPPSKIDWDKEAERATKDTIANAERQNSYRNLASLSPEQLNWVRQNHFEPAPAGIAWKYRRVEVAEGGFPIIHINDHCVAIPLLMMMVFCTIGHIEPNGTLFDHMRDPRSP